MSNSLEERLKSHARSFDGLLSLIPAKLYYGEDVSDQWKRKKQTKEEANAAKRAKLDPSAAKSAKDILDEVARKRKREEDDADISDIEIEAPREGLKKPAKQQKLKARSEETGASSSKSTDERKAERVAKKDKRKEERLQKQQDRKQAKQEKAKHGALKNKEAKQTTAGESQPTGKAKKSDEPETLDDALGADELDDIEMEDLEAASIDHESESSILTPAVDMSAVASASSSISSLVPPDEEADDGKTTSEPNPQELRARLDAKISAMRAARKAVGEDGKQPRSRQELLEERRQKAEQRKAHKKELRRKEKEQERLRIIEEAAAKVSKSPVSSPALENNFSFGTIAFDDGSKVDPSLAKFADKKKKKGPQDYLGALKSASNKQARLKGLDEEKRANLEQKDLWLHAKMRASGEKVKDDVSLLKKSLKRQQKLKTKSGTEWRARIEGVEKSIAAKQKKREENLRKRREEKGMKGKKKSTGKKKKSRPGFEGSFSTKARKA